MQLTIDVPEAQILEAALAIYRNQLHHARDLGGDARDAAHVMDPIAARVQGKVHEALYAPELPKHYHLSDHDPECDCVHINRVVEDDQAGDHYVYPAGVGR